MALAFRRTLGLGLAAILFLVLVGTTYQGVATALERRRFPHPGGLVKAGRHQLHLHCTGDGSPIVVLEAPATAMSSAWGGVQPIVAEETRVCSYDRAGLGWSEWGELTFDPAAVPVQLRTLLTNAGEQGPFILAGQGFGAALAKLTAARYPEEVAVLIMIDAPRSGSPADGRQLTSVSPWLARTGFLRVGRGLAGDQLDLPEDAAGALRSFLLRPDHLTRSARELDAWDTTVAAAAGAQLPPQIEVRTIDIAGQNRTAMLTRRADAARAARAILDSVEAIRKEGGSEEQTRPTNDQP